MEEEDLTCFWGHQEVVDELKHELLYATIELESTRMEANEAVRKSKATIRELMEDLDTARQERDEAKGQLHKLLNKIDMLPASFSAAAGLMSNVEAEPSPTSPLQRQLHRNNSSITDSTSLSHGGGGGGGSSPVDSFFDAVSSPDFSTVNLGDSSNANTNTSNNSLMFVAGPSLVPEYHAVPEAGRNVMDQASLIIDGLSKGKPLPQKGRLLEAVMAAGPLLQTLFVAGPLPQWRNPPPSQPLKVVPPVPIKGCDVVGGGMLMNQKVLAAARVALNPSPTYLEMSSGGSSSSFNFANGFSSATCLPGMPLPTSASSFNCQIRGGKRPKFQ